jgi:hypothetical protein
MTSQPCLVKNPLN